MDAFHALSQVKRVVANDNRRTSRVKFGQARSSNEQHEDHLRDCEVAGWVFGTSYSEDRAISASRHTDKVRVGWEALIDDLAVDRFKANVLMLWESSRGSRRVPEWTHLLDLCEARSVFIWVHTHQKLYDPANPRDRRSLLEDAVDSEYESAKISMRTRRSAAASANAGRPSGPVPYGYQRIYGPRTRAFVAQEPVEGEAKHVTELFARLLAGHSLRGIAADWEQRGIGTRSGKFFSDEWLRGMALSPTYAGLRGHATGRKGGNTPQMGADQLYPAQWEGLVSVADWHAVQRLLRSPERKTSRPGRGKYLLSMIARCGKCGGPLSVGFRKDRGEYACSKKGCIRIHQDDLDKHVTAVLLAYLAEPDVLTELHQRDQTENEEIERLRGEFATAQKQHKDLVRSWRAKQVSIEFVADAEPELLADIVRLKEQLKALDVPTALRGLVEPGKDVAQRWEAAPMSTRRATARALLVAERIGELRVHSSPRRGAVRVPADERVRFWRNGDPTETPAVAA